MARLRPYFLRSHGVPQVDDRRVESGIVLINRNGLRWCDAPTEDGPDKTLYNCRKQRNDMGVFAPIMVGLASNKPDNETISMMQPISRHIVQPLACRSKRGMWALDRAAKGRMNTRLHAATDAIGRPVQFIMTDGQDSNHTGARTLVSKWLLSDRGYDADRFREANNALHPGAKVATTDETGFRS
jgi:transposase